LAKKAGVTEQTVYNKQKAWVARYKIDIALPYAYYRDALFFGQNSFSNPADRAANLAAHSGRHGDQMLRLRDKAARDFDRVRIEVVGTTIRAPLHKMPVQVANIKPPALTKGVAAPPMSPPVRLAAPAQNVAGNPLATVVPTSNASSPLPAGRTSVRGSVGIVRAKPSPTGASVKVVMPTQSRIAKPEATKRTLGSGWIKTRPANPTALKKRR